MVSLGCDKNRVDTENVLFALTERGYQLTQNVNEADILVVNTCAFITTAVRESIDTILELAEQKQNRDSGYSDISITGSIFRVDGAQGRA